MKALTLGKIDFKKALLIIYYVFLAFTGVLPSQMLALLFLVISILLFPYEEFFYLMPGILVYYSWFIIPIINISLYRVYTLILVLKILSLFNAKKIKIQSDIVFILIPLFLHALLSVSFANVRTGVFYIFDLIIMVCIFSSGFFHEEQIKTLLSLMVIACALSVLSGHLLNNYIDLSYELNGVWEEVLRFRGTFVDPNYCGFLYTFSILFCLCLKPFKKWLRILLVLVLILGIIMTISFSSYISLVAMCFVFIIIYRKIGLKTVFALLFIAVGLVLLYFYGVNNPDASIIGGVSYRIQSYLSDTSNAIGRSKIWETVYTEFEAQNLFKKLFGMNAHAPVLNMNSGELIPAHNDYVEMLYNCGLLLTLLFYLGIFIRTVKHYIRFRRDGDKMSGFTVMSKLTWLVFSFTLSMISERVFMPILFL